MEFPPLRTVLAMDDCAQRRGCSQQNSVPGNRGIFCCFQEPISLDKILTSLVIWVGVGVGQKQRIAPEKKKKISVRAADSRRGALLAPESKCKSLIQGHFSSGSSLGGAWTPSRETSQQPKFSKSLKSSVRRVQASPSGWR